MKILCYLLSLAAAMLLAANASAQDGRFSYTLYENSYQDGNQKAKGGQPKAKRDVEDLPLKEHGKNGPWMEPDDSDEPNGCNGDDDNGNGCGDDGEDDGCGDEGGCGEEEEEDECKCYCYLFGPDESISYWDEMWDHCDDCCKPKINIGGWLQAGYHNKPTPLSMERGDLLAFNDVPHNLELHQGWLYMEKSLDPKECCWDWGFRVDAVYGTDAQKTQAFGNTPDAAGNARGWDNDWDHGVYGWALPQAYVEYGTTDFSVKVGHFYTLVGYEVVTAPDNFFFSHALTMFNSEPFTHTGVLTTWTLCDDVEVFAGWTAGWDTGFDRNDDGSSWLGGFAVQLLDDVKFTYISTAGDFGWRGEDAYSHSLLFDVQLTDCVNYVLQSDLVRVRTARAGGGHLGDDDIGINQYLFYTYNDCLAFGTRIEWWKDDGVSNYECTYGINYRPHANMIIRPEMRHDWVPATDFREDIFAVDMIFTF